MRSLRKLGMLSLVCTFAMCAPVQTQDKPTGNEATAVQEEEIDTVGLFCEAHCRREIRCSLDTYENYDCLCACRHILQAPLSHLMPEFMQVVSKCLETLECGRADDVCFARGNQAILEKNPRRLLLQKRCMEIRRTCRFMDDYCRALVGLLEEYASKANACFSGECPVMGDCLLDAIGRKEQRKDPRCRKSTQDKN